MTKEKITVFQVLILLKKEDCQLAANKLNNQYYFNKKMRNQ